MHHILVKLGYKPSPKTKQNRFTRTMPRMIIPNVCIFSQVGVIFQTQFTLLYHKMPQKWFGVWVCVEISDASANRLIGHMEDTTKMDLGRQSGMDWPLVPKRRWSAFSALWGHVASFCGPSVAGQQDSGKIETGWRCWWSLFASVWNMFASEMTSFWDSTLNVHTVPHLVPVYCMTLQHLKACQPITTRAAMHDAKQGKWTWVKPWMFCWWVAVFKKMEELVVQVFYRYSF